MAIFLLAMSIHLWYNEVNERSDFMKIKETEAIKAAEILRQYCGDVLCTDCIFNFRGDCILSESNHNYVPNDWLIDLIKDEAMKELNKEVK